MVVVKYVLYFQIMAETDMDEPPEKRARVQTNFKLCIKCQTNIEDHIRQQPKDTSYEKFIAVVQLRATFGEQEFISIRDRLGNITVQQLKDDEAVWHSKCYSDATNQTNVKRAQIRHEKAIKSQDASLLKRRKGRPSLQHDPCQTHDEPHSSSSVAFTRSHKSLFSKLECFFCQGERTAKLHICRTANVGSQIADIVKHSDNKTWKVNYAELLNQSDALSRDIMYHKICMTEQWKSCHTAHPNISSRSAENDNPPTLNFIAAEIQFYSQLQDRLQAGEIISIDEVAQDYESIMSEHQMTNSLTRAGLRVNTKAYR